MAEWRQGGYDGLFYLGRERGMDYMGYVVRSQGADDGLPEKWLVYAWDHVVEETVWVADAPTREAAQKALENITPGGHKCEVLVNQYLGHCPERATVVKTYEGDTTRGVLVCDVHRRKTLADQPHESVARWEAIHGPITHESGPIIGERIAPVMAPVKRSDFLSRPVIWGDDWGAYVLGMVLAQDVSPGTQTEDGQFATDAHLVMFNGTGAFEVKSVDPIEIPGAGPHYRFNCNGGATYLAEHDSAVPVLYLPL